MHSLRPFDAVCFWDPAIVREPGLLRDYVNTRDASQLRYVDGRRPMTFRCRHIPNRWAAALSERPTDNAVRLACFALGVYEVRNASTRDGRRGEDFRPRAVCENPQHLDAQGVPLPEMSMLWDDEELGRSFDLTTIYEIGEVIRALTFLPVTIEPSFALPPTSLELARRNLRLLAALESRPASSGTDTGQPASEQTSSAAAAAAPGGVSAETVEDSPVARSILASKLSGEP